MEEQTTKRTRRTISKEEKIQKLQDEIAKHEIKIAELKAKIADLEKPPIGLRDVTARIKAMDVPLVDVMKALDKLDKK